MNIKNHFTKREFLLGAAGLSSMALSGCATRTMLPEPIVLKSKIEPTELFYVNQYGPLYEEKFPIPAVDLKKVDKRFYRQKVDYFSEEEIGTVIVDTQNFYLYLIEGNGRAMRYGVGLGRAGFESDGDGR